MLQKAPISGAPSMSLHQFPPLLNFYLNRKENCWKANLTKNELFTEHMTERRWRIFHHSTVVEAKQEEKSKEKISFLKFCLFCMCHLTFLSFLFEEREREGKRRIYCKTVWDKKGMIYWLRCFLSPHFATAWLRQSVWHY